MSLLSPFTKKSKLSATIKQTEEARKSDGNTRDGLFKAAYQGYAEVLQDDALRAETLYHWGFALFNQASTKSAEEAASLYQDAIEKFSFCMLINPNYLAAAVNSGVAYMDLARLNQVKADDQLYLLAKKQFEKANVIQAGTASYNLACIYGLQGNINDCLAALENARVKVTLPAINDILNDPDMSTVRSQAWFTAFIESLNKDIIDAKAKVEADIEAKIIAEEQKKLKKVTKDSNYY
jgi:tetratricopeptide (TPR) repeat protein